MSVEKNIATVRNCPADITMLNSLFGFCLFVWSLKSETGLQTGRGRQASDWTSEVNELGQVHLSNVESILAEQKVIGTVEAY